MVRLKNLLPPIGLIGFGWIPTDALASAMNWIIPASVIPVGMSALELVALVLQVVSLVAGLVWVTIQIFLKVPEIKKRFRKK